MSWIRERSRVLLRGPKSPGVASRPPAPTGWTAVVRSARWSACGLTIGGWVYVDGIDTTSQATVQVSLVDVASGRTLSADVRRRHDHEVNHVAGDPEHDYADGAFGAELPMPPEDSGHEWDVQVSLAVGGQLWTGPLTDLFRRGSPGSMARRFLDGGAQINPTWVPQRGLVLQVVRRQVTARSSSSSTTAWCSETTSTGRRPVAADLQGPDGSVEGEVLDVRRDAGVWHARLRFPLPAAGSGDWSPHVRLSGGSRRPVHWSGPDVAASTADVNIAVTPTGMLRLTHPADEVVVDDIDVDTGADPAVILRGRASPPGGRFTLRLDGRRAASVVEVAVADGRFDVRLPLSTTSDLWSSGPLPLPIGTYRAEARDPDDRSLHVRLTQDVLEHACGRWSFGPAVMARPERGSNNRLEVRLAPPRAPDEWSELGQRREDDAYRRRAYAQEDLVFFESFLGKRAACNPLAIRHEVARRSPGLRRVWGVFEGSVPVPDGDGKVVIGTRAWRDARGSARYVVTNDWLRRFEHRPFQTFVQTWHGTPLKKLALDRRPRGLDPAYQALVREETSHWDVLVSQSPFMTEALRGAYGYEGPVLEVGYPRNDLLAHPDAPARRRIVRERLGLAEESTVVLYAPTWRDEKDRSTPPPPDPMTLAARLGPSTTLLVRGHAENIRHDRRIEGPHLLDVTLYPDVSELFLVADALVTDYSSVMFDFAVTGKPMVFYAPDIEDYRDVTRGLYLALEDIAPGPVLHSSEAVADALADLTSLRAEHHDAYVAWQSRFVPLDDGSATARAVDAVWPDHVAS
ncbi:CDP-glycerol glycerophosphotransferase family protein [Mumia sp. Pv 4-285]|uniref:CDP-glycerol glycerophosphotransferase family protein n=1 Tax=Mumia qirimensis TaxID=3234852 RepID=UPI00351D2E31